MSKVIIISDLHLRMYTDTIVEEGIPLKLKEIFDSFETVCSYALLNGINKIFILGDINDLKTYMHVKPFLYFISLIRKYDNLEFYILGGNHDVCDRYFKDSMFSSIEMLSLLPNVRVFIKPDELFLDGKKVLLLPYYDSDTIRSYIDNFDGEVVFGHLGLSDIFFKNGLSIVSDFSVKDFAKFKYVFFGHFHNPQDIKVDETFIIYVGSIVPIRRDEINEDKRFIVFDLDKMEYISVTIEGYRKYYEYIVDGSKTEEEVLKDLEELKNRGFIVFVKLVSKVPYRLPDCKVIDLTEEDFSVRGIMSSMSIKEQMEKYLDFMGIDDSYKDVYLKIGLEAIKEQ